MDMHGCGTDAEAGDRRHDGHAASGWCQPLGSPDATRLLIDLVVDRLAMAAGPNIEGDLGAEVGRSVEVDVELGIVRSRNRRWSATLAPLAAQLVDIPPDGWSTVIDREIQRWHRAIAAVDRLAAVDRSGRLRSDARPVVVRLTPSSGIDGRTLRPAFGDMAWELVLDLGSDGLAALPPAAEEPDMRSERSWSRSAAKTVKRYEESWARLTLDDRTGVVLSGPYVSALLYDPSRLRTHLEAPLAGRPLRATIFTNSLLLITARGEHRRSAPDVVTESLRRFTSNHHRRFEPFTLDLADPEYRRHR